MLALHYIIGVANISFNKSEQEKCEGKTREIRHSNECTIFFMFLSMKNGMTSTTVLYN